MEGHKQRQFLIFILAAITTGATLLTGIVIYLVLKSVETSDNSSVGLPDRSIKTINTSKAPIEKSVKLTNKSIPLTENPVLQEITPINSTTELKEVKKNFGGVNWEGKNLQGMNLQNVNFGGANLAHTNLSGVDLRNSNLSGANLSNANLSNAKLINVDLRGSNMSNTNLRGADLNGARLEGANFTGAIMP